MENNILNSLLSNRQLFVVPEADSSLKACSGSNQSPFLVVYLKEEQMAASMEFLKKILAAINFDIDKDVLLLEVTELAAQSFIALKTKTSIQKVLLLGAKPQQLGLHFDSALYKPFKHLDCEFLLADKLSTIAEDRNLKAGLWNGLKQLFPPAT